MFRLDALSIVDSEAAILSRCRGETPTPSALKRPTIDIYNTIV
jgi:hypothetical protein